MYFYKKNYKNTKLNYYLDLILSFTVKSIQPTTKKWKWKFIHDFEATFIRDDKGRFNVSNTSQVTEWYTKYIAHFFLKMTKVLYSTFNVFI